MASEGESIKWFVISEEAILLIYCCRKARERNYDLEKKRQACVLEECGDDGHPLQSIVSGCG